MRNSCRIITSLALLVVFTLPAAAYNPPVDTAGPVTVRIEAAEVVRETNVPLPVRVVIENKDSRPVDGTLALRVIDDWRTEPGEPVKFSVQARGTSTYNFHVVAAKGTYRAHYPIHALARFQLDGKQYTAHPILVVEAEVPPPAREPIALPWKAIALEPDGQLALWRTPVRRAVVQVFGQQPQTMPVGWEGSEPKSRASLQVSRQTLGGRSQSTVAMHPPWFEGNTGTMLVEYPVRLPDSKPLTLSFANAVTPTGQGDGVTFRVRVLSVDAPAGQFGKVVYEQHVDAKTWQDAEADLSAYAGQTVRLQLESHPGPANNTGWDQSYWAEPMLTAGMPRVPAPFPPKDENGSRLVGTVGQGDQGWEIRLWPGRRGLLDAMVGFGQGDQRVFFRGFQVRVLGGRIDDERSPVRMVKAVEEPTPDGCQVRHSFEGPVADFDVVGRLWVERGVLRAGFRLETDAAPRPWMPVYLEDVATGPWSRPVQQVYAGHGNVVRQPGAYRLSFDGHRLATSFVGFDFADGLSMVQAVDNPPDALEVRPDEHHYSLHVAHDPTLTFIPAADVWQAVKRYRATNGLKAAGGVRKLAGRFVFDLWGGRYGSSRESLKQAFRYGLTDACVVWHNWQRWGYDYRLPEIYPANPHWGTHEELQELIESCQQAGVLFALHDNYIDFYPDAEGFSYEKVIAFNQGGEPVKAWLNEGRGARSYRYRADQVEPFLRQNLETIRDGLRPDAYFIDVWSSIQPYRYFTADGRFFTRVYTRDSWAKHFDWIRELFGDDAPQISESGHDQLIGHLDGAQTNHLRIGNLIPGHRYTWSALDWSCDDAERTPWFDAAHHDRFVLHGAGYESRYRAGLDRRLHGIFSDDYLATEVLTGHPAMVPEPFSRDVVRKYWLTHDLMRALALRTIEQVEYSDGDLHRQHVQWSGGGEVWVNRGETEWTVAGTTLPQYGFLAKVETDDGPVEASIARRDGLIVETARSPRQIYVNARRLVDGPRAIRTSVKQVQYHGGRRFTLALTWQLDEPVPPDYRPFFHFVDERGEILFQATQDPKPLADAGTGRIETTAGGYLPEGASAGDEYGLCVGFYRPADGHRLALVGPDDGTRRIWLGSITLQGEGAMLSGVRFTPEPPKTDRWLARQNAKAKPIDFGPIETAGGCRVARDGDALLITPLPSQRGPAFTVRLRPSALPWNLPELTKVEALGEDGRALKSQPLARDGQWLKIECEPGVFAYRLVK